MHQLVENNVVGHELIRMNESAVEQVAGRGVGRVSGETPFVNLHHVESSAGIHEVRWRLARASS